MSRHVSISLYFGAQAISFERAHPSISARLEVTSKWPRYQIDLRLAK